MRLAILIILFLITAFCAKNALSADISIGNAPWGEELILIDGEISTGDLIKILELSKKLLLKNKELQFRLNSSGGDFFEALDIGKFIKKLHARTMIVGEISRDPSKPLTNCFSSCFLIFTSGSIRDYNGNNQIFDSSGNKLVKTIPVLGIHRPKINPAQFGSLSPNDAKASYKMIFQDASKFLSDSGVPKDIIDEMFRVSSQEIRLITKEEFIKRIGFTQAYFAEWIQDKCGALEKKELKDLAEIRALRILSNDSEIIPKSMSEGYVNYLIKKQNQINFCKTNTLISHQKSVLIIDD
ncbi:MAG: hypothetical protein OEZ51_14330 [Nitrospinota bacterium]|nr:hypothetical protein [Nitrospinota bacterium]